MIVGYARVSTVDQDPQLQLNALNDAGVERTYIEQVSGAAKHRPKLERALEHVREGDTFVVWRLDRLGRNLRHLIDVMEDLAERGVHFKSLTEGFDTTTPVGRFTFQLFGGLAEFERALIRERTLAGLEAARRQGRTGGRPRALTRAQRDEARKMVLQEGRTCADVAKLFRVSRSTISRLTKD